MKEPRELHGYLGARQKNKMKYTVTNIEVRATKTLDKSAHSISIAASARSSLVLGTLLLLKDNGFGIQTPFSLGILLDGFVSSVSFGLG
jgi:hypothetical protein